MNPNRRAALQRKLAVAPVPKPPAGLATKIKNDIPKELRFSAERERARMQQSMRLSIAVAASVIVVIAAAFLALQVTENTQTQPAVSVPVKPKPILQLPAVVSPPAAQAVKPQQKEESRSLARRAKQVEVKTEAAQEPQSLDAASGVTAAAADRAAAPAAAPAAARANIAPPPNRDARLQALKDELARGADPKDVAKKAREEGFDEFAKSIEKKKPELR